MDSKYLTRHPKDQLFYRVLAFFMYILALNSQYWPWFDIPRHKLYRMFRKSMFVMVPIVVISQLIYFVLHYSELPFETVSTIYTICLFAVIVLVCVLLYSLYSTQNYQTFSLVFLFISINVAKIKFYVAQTKSYKIAMEDFMTRIHVYNYYITDQKGFACNALIAAEKTSRWSCFYYMFFVYVTYTCFETFPIIHNFQKIESYDNITFRLEIVVHLWLPFDYEFNFTNWVIAQVAAIILGFLAITYIFVFDTVNMVVIYHLIGHISILKLRIQTKFNDENMTQEEIRDTFIEISQYYTFITQSVKTSEAAFGLNVATIYLYNLVGGGLFIYQIMISGNVFTYGLLLPTYMGILIIISFALERIRTTAEDIPDLIYGIKNWENMSLSNQKLLLNLLVQVQPTLEFTAAFNIKTGVQPAISIIKTAFSYYVMIKSTMTI